ncbi:MAG: hypothetical protein ACR2FM_01585 [Candidatus Saccharimonadales bacterium]
MKFKKYNISNNGFKAKVHYSKGVSVRTGTDMIVAYERGYTKDWAKIFDKWEDESDVMTDYFDTRKVRFYEGSKQYNELKELMKAWGLIN